MLSESAPSPHLKPLHFETTPLVICPSFVKLSPGGDDEPHVKKGVKLTRLHDCPLTVVTSTLKYVY